MSIYYDSQIVLNDKDFCNAVYRKIGCHIIIITIIVVVIALAMQMHAIAARL